MGFLRMVSTGSGDSLDQYDPRTASSHALAALDGSATAAAPAAVREARK